MLLCFCAPQVPPPSVRCRMALLLMRWTSREGNRPLPPAGHTAAARAGAPRDARSGEGTGLTGREQGRAPCRLQSDGDGGDGVWFHGGRGAAGAVVRASRRAWPCPECCPRGSSALPGVRTWRDSVARSRPRCRPGPRPVPPFFTLSEGLVTPGPATPAGGSAWVPRPF